MFKTRSGNLSAFRRVQGVRRLTRMHPYAPVRYSIDQLNKFEPSGRARRLWLAREFRKVKAMVLG